MPSAGSFVCRQGRSTGDRLALLIAHPDAPAVSDPHHDGFDFEKLVEAVPAEFPTLTALLEASSASSA
jgi:hypothetical protein